MPARPQRPRRAPRAIAWALTVLTALQALTLVVAAIRGGPVTDALVFFSTGIVVLMMTAVTLAVWRWARSTAVPVIPAEPEREGHRGLTGKETPPTRW